MIRSLFRSLAGAAGPTPGSPEVSPAAVTPVNVPEETPNPLRADLVSNEIVLGENIQLIGEISGTGNRIHIESARRPQKLYISVYGNDNQVTIGRRSLLSNLRLDIGSRRWSCSQARLVIGESFSIGSNGRFILPNSGNVVEIGDRCMFSNSITLRGGEYPHLIFDLQNGEYLDVSEGIFIGDHVWVGEGAYISKGVTIPKECIVGARGVVTRRFDKENAVIAGNPAKVVKEGIQWMANEYALRKYPALGASFDSTQVKRINDGHRLIAATAISADDDEGEVDGASKANGMQPPFAQFD